MDNEQKIKLLQEKAAVLEGSLKKYAEQDEKVREVLKFMSPLFRKIEKGLICPPNYDSDFSAYFSGEVDDGFGGLHRRYPAMFEEYAQYAAVLRDWISSPLYRQGYLEDGEPIWWEQTESKGDKEDAT